MTQPDYSKYSEEELRQVRSNIDAARFPERVAQIDERLATLASAPRATAAAADDNASKERAAKAVVPASRRRRTFAFVIDSLLLGVTGLVVGAILSKQFAALGPWGRLLGFAIAVTYFGVTQSRIGGGQSPGMRILGLKLIHRDGSLLEPWPAMGRAALFCVAYFLSSLPAYLSGGNPWITGLVSMPLFAVYFSIAYLLVFNRKTHQSLHDLVVGAHVVKADNGPLALPAGPVWRGHAIIASASIVVMTVAGILFTLPIWSQNPFTSMIQLQQALTREPGVQNVTLAVNFYQSNGVTVPALRVNAIIDASVSQREAMAYRIARTALANYPDAQRLRSVTVTLSTGYDIGIATSFRSWNYSHPPADWQTASSP